MDMIILALSRWDGKYSSTILSLAKVFAREHRVFYMDNPFTVKDVLTGLGTRQIWRRLPALLFGVNCFHRPYPELPNFVVVTPLMTWSINWLNPGRLFNLLARFNDRLIYQAIRKTIYKYDLGDYVFINSFNPLYGNQFPRRFKPRKRVYHCVDDIKNSPYVQRHGGRLEHIAAQQADVVITTSKELARLKAKEAKKVCIVPNAANVGLFQNAFRNPLSKPLDLIRVREGQKVITYIGNICHRLDYDLLIAIADQLPDMVLLMVGPFANNSYKETGLSKRGNVIFTGKKTLEELPAYLQYSDCCIIPFLCNTLTRSIYPLKINEYLSAGKPVVTTPFSEDIQDFEEVVNIADTHAQFISEIEQAIATDHLFLQNRRVEFSAANNWENRAVHFMKIINDSDDSWKNKEKLLLNAKN